MKDKPGAIITELSGSLNGHTARRSRAGQVITAKATQVNKGKQAQLSQRSRLHVISQRWRELTQAQRQTWIASAPRYIGQTNDNGQVKLSGFECFKLVNMRRLLFGLAVTTLPMSFTAPRGFTSFSIIADASSQALTLTLSGVNPGTYQIIVEATPPMSAGITNPNSSFSIIRLLTMANPVNVAIATEWIAKYGTLRVGQKIFVRVTLQTVASSLRSQPRVQSATVVP